MLVKRLFNKIENILGNRQYHYLAPGVVIPKGVNVWVKDNLVMCEGTSLEPGTTIQNINAKFIMGKKSVAGPNLTVVAGNHMSIIGKFLIDVTEKDKKEQDPTSKLDQDVVLEEDVWLGANVVLLNGVRIGRGAIIAAGTVCRTNIPPYSIVLGNPAKVVGFRFSPIEIIEHEKCIYNEDERLAIELLEKNYKKYFLDRLKDINNLCKI